MREWNLLIKQFHEGVVDISSISISIEVTLASLRRKFLGVEFGKGTMLKQFMSDTKNGIKSHLNYVGQGCVHELFK